VRRVVGRGEQVGDLDVADPAAWSPAALGQRQLRL